MKKAVLILTIILISLTSTIYAETIPTFTLTTIDDKNITITETKEGLEFHEFKGKAVLLTLFGHRCPPCLKEIPEFIELTKEHKDDLSIVAIEAQWYPVDKLKKFVTDHKINYNVVAGDNHNDFINYIADRALPKEEEGQARRGIPLPLLIAINKDGEAESIKFGLIHKDELEMLIQDLND